MACLSGYLDIVKYLYETFKDKEMNKAGFDLACYKNHLDIVKYLSETFKDDKIMHFGAKHAFI